MKHKFHYAFNPIETKRQFDIVFTLENAISEGCNHYCDYLKMCTWMIKRRAKS